MKKVLALLFISILTYSCASTYYYPTLTTTDESFGQAENGDFMTENDDFWIAYSFNGWNAPIRVTIFNKSQEILYVDWKRSILSIEAQTLSYANSFAFVGTGGKPIAPKLFDAEGQEIKVEGESMQDFVSLIPSQAMVSVSPYSLGYISFNHLNDSLYTENEWLDKDGKTQKIEQINFTTQLTPVKLKNYLTLYKVKEKPILFEHEFYIGKLTKTKGLSPNKLPEKDVMRGDVFYILDEPPYTSTKWNIRGGIAF